MTKHRKLILPQVLLLLLLVGCVGASAKEPIEIRVGITEYQRIEETYAKYQDFFQELSDQSKQHNVTFKIAIGTYGEVRDWYSKNLIDVVILSAMPLAEMFISAGRGTEMSRTLKEAYIGMLTPKPSSVCKGGGVGHSLREELYPKGAPPDAEGFYHMECIVPFDSEVKDVTQLAQASDKSQFKFLFIRPYSVSGYLLPAYHLKTKLGLEIKALDYEFTRQHSTSLQRLMQAKDGKENGKHLIAFVLNTTAHCTDGSNPQRPHFRKLDTNDWEKDVPSEAVLINHNMKPERFAYYRQAMAKILSDWKESERSRLRFKRRDDATVDDWENSYTPVIKVLHAVQTPRVLPNRFTMDEILSDLAWYKRNNKLVPGIEPDMHASARPLRLALVLSGGGAKCAYQTGAINALEEKLKERDMDVDLVVGTSGGAMNALFTALGVTKTQSGRGCLMETWARFKQEDFFQPSWGFNSIFGICFGLLQALFFSVSALLFGRRGGVSFTTLGKALVAIILVETVAAIYFDYLNTLSTYAASLILKQVIAILLLASAVKMLSWKLKDWWRQAGLMLLLVSLVEVLLKFWGGPATWPLDLDKDHVFLHSWMLLQLFSLWSAPIPVLLGVIMFFAGKRHIPRVDWESRRTHLIRGLIAGLLVATSASVLYSFLREHSPSYSAGIESKFADELPKLLGCSGRPINLGLSTEVEPILSDLSQKIISNKLIQRDLIITASRLPMNEQYESKYNNLTTAHQFIKSNELPYDLYFYYSWSGAQPPSLGKNFISFSHQANMNKLLDVVIGSSTIYPLFPYRKVRDVQVDTRRVEEIKIIDGGFIHNSPVDAAVRWGATHVILLQASPSEKPFAPRHFWDNSRIALSYLFTQAQSLDLISRGSVEMFELAPTSECDKLDREFRCSNVPQPDMDTFDFAPSLLSEAYNQGYEDMRSPQSLLMRVPGLPLFRSPKRLAPELQ